MGGGMDHQSYQFDYSAREAIRMENLNRLKKDINYWLIEEVLPFEEGLEKVRVYLKEISDENFVLAVEDDIDLTSLNFKFPTQVTKADAQVLLRSTINTLQRITNIAVVETWEENLPVDVSALPKYKLVKFVNPLSETDPYYYSYPFKNGESLLFLGEIEQMPGHCVVVQGNKDGKIHYGYHTDNFVELTDDEV